MAETAQNAAANDERERPAYGTTERSHPSPYRPKGCEQQNRIDHQAVDPNISFGGLHQDEPLPGGKGGPQSGGPQQGARSATPSSAQHPKQDE